MSGRGGEEHTLSEMESKCALLLGELKDVVAEYDAPKVSDQCDDVTIKIKSTESLNVRADSALEA
jgi:hypothetical protein